MKMMYFDTFESIGPNVQLSGAYLDRHALLGIWYEGTSLGGNNNERMATITGALSPIAIKTGTSRNVFPMFLGDITSYQVSGKVVFGAACSAKLDTTRSIFTVCSGETYNSTYSRLEIASDKTVSFLEESAVVDEVVSSNYAYYELIIDLDNSTFGVYVNNKFLFDGVHSFTKIWNVMALGGAATNTEVFLDDIYVLGGTSGPYNDRLGPVRAVRTPLLAATKTEFTPTGTASNLQAVNKTSLSTTTFNRSPASNGKQDRFTVDASALPDDKDVFAVQQLLYYRKTDIGDRGLKSVITDAGAVNTDSIELPQNISNFAGGVPHIIEEVPGGGTLDKDSVATLEFGYEVTAT